LSKFTGAATELLDALIVNPYDIEAWQGHPSGPGDEPDERRKRMHRMRHHVMDHNIYRWAASILGDLRELRMESSGTIDPIHALSAYSVPTEELGTDRT